MGKIKFSKILILIFITVAVIGAVLFLKPSVLFHPSGDSEPASLELIDSELAKLLYIVEQHRNGDFKVIVDGRAYDPSWGAQFARQFLNQKGSDITDAETWIKRHTYRSLREGEIILFRYPDGREKPMREAFLESLASLNLQLAENPQNSDR